VERLRRRLGVVRRERMSRSGIRGLTIAMVFQIMILPPAPETIATPTLHLPHEDFGACPFECCTYTTWTANTLTSVRNARTAKSPIRFRVVPKEEVVAITGVVVTTRPGRARVLRSASLGGVPVALGDEVLVLHYLGEGNWKLWIKGRIVEDQVRGPQHIVGGEELPARIVEQPRITWWVQIRNSRGQIGWSDRPDHFDHKDACE
jgi:hypothetical protein